MTEPPITRQAAHVSAGSNLPVTRVVIHATCPDIGWPFASKVGAASGTAKYFQMASSGGSAHYVEGVDREEHCVRDNAIAWHAPPSVHSVGIEITADGGDTAAFKDPAHNYTRAQWLSPQVWPAVVRAAARTKELCERFNIPKVRIGTADLLAGRHGICGHVNVSQAWHQSDHSDPGPYFPWAEFMALVTSSTPPVEDMFMALTQAQQDEIFLAAQTTLRMSTVQHPTKVGVRWPAEVAWWSNEVYTLQVRDLLVKLIGLEGVEAAAFSKMNEAIGLVDDQVVAALRPAIEAAAATGGTPAQIADAVVAALAAQPAPA